MMSGEFLRETVHGVKRLGRKWRKPHGLQSKVRQERKGRPAMPKVGYKSGTAWRGMHPSGSQEFFVRNMHDLERASGRAMAIRISSAVGDLKKSEMLRRAKELNLTVLNP
jgi:large subunit ribosomal protein L32e